MLDVKSSNGMFLLDFITLVCVHGVLNMLLACALLGHMIDLNSLGSFFGEL